MNVSDLLAKYPDDLTLQVLTPCITNARTRKGGVCEVSFVTTQMQPVDLVAEPRMVGLIVWIPKRIADELTADAPKLSPRAAWPFPGDAERDT